MDFGILAAPPKTVLFLLTSYSRTTILGPGVSRAGFLDLAAPPKINMFLLTVEKPPSAEGRMSMRSLI